MRVQGVVTCHNAAEFADALAVELEDELDRCTCRVGRVRRTEPLHEAGADLDLAEDGLYARNRPQ